MSKQNLDNKTIDLIGRRLFDIDGPRSNDIAKIVSNPHLFALVKARIAANEKLPAAELKSERTLPYILTGAITFAGVAMVLIAIGVTGLVRPEKGIIAFREVQVPEAIPDVARSETPFKFKPLVNRLS